MLPKEKFPPKPFSGGEWLRLLRKIGLKQDVTKDQLQKFVNEVAMGARGHETQLRKSKVLVCHLFENSALHQSAFLRSVSTVKFFAPHKVSDKLAAFHVQYSCISCDEHPPFVAFIGAVNGRNENLVWESAPLHHRRPFHQRMSSVGLLGFSRHLP